MTTFNDREKAFEKKFEHDQDIQFKVTARKNKMLGLWAAGLMGKSGADAEAYAKEVVLADFEKPGDSDVVAKLVKDLAAAGKRLVRFLHHLRLGLGHQALALLADGVVVGRLAGSSEILHQLCHDIAIARLLEVGQDDFLGIGLAYALPDARSAAGHGRDMSLKKACHCFPPDFFREEEWPDARLKEKASCLCWERATPWRSKITFLSPARGRG